MADHTKPEVRRQVVRNREYVEYSDGRAFTRKLGRGADGPHEWVAVQPPQTEPPGPAPKQLHLIMDVQAENELKHWCLFACRHNPRGPSLGRVWQVTGDAECMRYEAADRADRFNSEAFHWHQTLNSDLSDGQEAQIDAVARSEPPPKAVNRAAVRENCQGWAVRVLWHLADLGIVEKAAVEGIQMLVQPVD